MSKGQSNFVTTIKKAMMEKGLNNNTLAKKTKNQLNTTSLSRILNGALPTTPSPVDLLAVTLGLNAKSLRISVCREKITEFLRTFKISENEIYSDLKEINTKLISVVESDALDSYLDDHGFLKKRSPFSINVPTDEFGSDCYGILIKSNVFLHDRYKQGEVVIVAVGSPLGPPPDWGIIRWQDTITLAKIRKAVAGHYIIENYSPYQSEFIPKKLVKYIHPFRAALEVGVNVI